MCTRSNMFTEDNICKLVSCQQAPENAKYLYKTKDKMDNSERKIPSIIEKRNKEIKDQMENYNKNMSNFIDKKIDDLKVEIKKTLNLKGTKKAQGEIKTALKEGFKKLEEVSKKYKEDVKDVLMTEFEKSKNFMKANDDVFQNGGCYMLLAVKIALMIAVIVFNCTSTHISEVKPCELKAALDLVHLNYTFHSCKYGAVKEMSDQLIGLGKAEFWINVIITFFVIVCVYLSRFKNKKMRLFLLIFFLFLFVSALAFFVASIMIYCTFGEKKNENTGIDYIKLQSSLLSWLQNNYKTDTINNSDDLSRGWNNFFIQYDCCAVREVQTTTNDFDKTPWCTTSGSCQSTASQIPKTCCKDVTQDDYQNAPSTCHASVNSGTYRQSCIGRIRGLGVVDIDDVHVSMLCISLMTMIVLQMLEATLVSGILICGIIRHKRLQKEDL